MKRAKKVNSYVIEPKADGFSKAWESFHATNPSSIRLNGYDGVILAYRAGGENDKFFMYDKFVWGSSMGLCLLDSRGEKVRYRFPLPVFKCNRKMKKLPQTKEEFEEYQKIYKDELAVLHDFRLFSIGETLYVLMHDGTLTYCYDTIQKIEIKDFIDRINQSITLIDTNSVTEESWGEIWWKEGVFTPCGNDGTNKYWASTVNKTDIIVIQLENGKIQINHRAVPDYAVIETDGEVFSSATADGFTKYGVLENCVRPGFFDNSHVGNNGNPILATIKGAPVYLDIVHGVTNHSITDLKPDSPWDMEYVPYFRLKSTTTGEVLYYSKEPVLECDEIWKEYVQDGAWVSKLAHLRGVMFTGGQVAKNPDRITETDEFCFYTGVGDTAVAMADFKICDLMDEEEMNEVSNYRKNERNRKMLLVDENKFKLDDAVKGWDYSIMNKDGRASIVRKKKSGICAGETAVRPVHSCAGYFDFGASIFDGKSVYQTKYGTLIVLKGINYRYEGDKIYSKVGYGVVILSKEHPEKILYHSEKSIIPTEEFEGNTFGKEFKNFDIETLLGSIDKKVLDEILVTYEMIENGKTFSSDHKKWLESRAEV